MYKSTIKTASRELTKKESVQLKDLTECFSLGKEIEDTGESIIIKPSVYAIIHIENDSTDNKEYDVLVIQDENGTKYQTSSESFISSFIDIMNEMEDSDEEFSIKIVVVDSKKRQGKTFLKAILV